MKTLKYIQSKMVLPLALILITLVGCEREISDAAVAATFPTTAEIFIDAPVGLTDQFFRSFDPAAGANVNGFGVDNTIFYEGTQSIRIDVPASNDPDGGFIGGIFEDRGAGRDLSGYDALTFWARGTTSGTIQAGFGTDFDRGGNDPHAVSTVFQLTTGWKKYIIPMPDPSLLVQETGMFLFAAGGFDVFGDGPNGNEIAWTFWIDELKFERLGTNRLLNPIILGGQDIAVDQFTGFMQTIDGLGAIFNLADGQNLTVNAASGYFDFVSSDTSVATVTSTGDVNVIGAGEATISATLAGEQAQGSLAITSAGAFINAPDPTLPQSDVTSIFSDAYTSVTGFNPGVFAGGGVSNIAVQTFDGNNHLVFETIDFVGLGWDGSVNVSGETMVHLDVQLISAAGGNLVMELIDFGPDNSPDNGLTNVGGDGTAGGNNISSQLIPGQWVSIDIPLNQFTLPTGGGGFGNPALNNIGFVVFVSSNGASFLVDNIYFY